jgi:hypothetical protein
MKRNLDMRDTISAERCPCCGVVLTGGKAACKALFEQILAREYGDPAYAAVHLLTVDSYVLQHSEDHGLRSNAFHLLRLAWLLLGGGDPGIRWRDKGPIPFVLQAYRDFPFLAPPEDRGRAMVAEVVAAADSSEHAELVRTWGWSVWEAWSRHHSWVREALRKGGIELP